MSDPVTASAGITAVIMEWGSWIFGGGVILTIGKIIYDYATVKKEVKDLKEDQKEMKADMKAILACTTQTKEDVAVLKALKEAEK